MSQELELELELRHRDGDFLVRACSDWIDRVRQANADDFLVAELGPAYPQVVDDIDRLAAKALQASGPERLLAVEDLADYVIDLVVKGQLRTRTGPVDAAEEFYFFDIYRLCNRCQGRYGAFSEGQQKLCAHCFYEGTAAT